MKDQLPKRHFYELGINSTFFYLDKLWKKIDPYLMENVFNHEVEFINRPSIIVEVFSW